MKKSILIISSLLVVALFTGNAFAWGPCKGRGMGDGPGQNAFNALSQDQKDQVNALRQDFIDATYDIRAARFAKHQEIRMLMETSAPDRAKLETLSDEMMDIQKQLNGKRIDFQLAVKKIAPELNLEQGFGRGHGKRFGKDGQRGCQGKGQGQRRGQGQGSGYNCPN